MKEEGPSGEEKAQRRREQNRRMFSCSLKSGYGTEVCDWGTMTHVTSLAPSISFQNKKKKVNSPIEYRPFMAVLSYGCSIKMHSCCLGTWLDFYLVVTML